MGGVHNISIDDYEVLLTLKPCFCLYLLQRKKSFEIADNMYQHKILNVPKEVWHKLHGINLTIRMLQLSGEEDIEVPDFDAPLPPPPSPGPGFSSTGPQVDMRHATETTIEDIMRKATSTGVLFVLKAIFVLRH